MSRRHAILLLLCCLGSGCDSPTHERINTPTGRSEAADLVSLAFQALKSGDVALVEPLVMNEPRYRRLIEQLAAADETSPMVTDAEIRSLATEAEESLAKSFQLIRQVLEKLQFNLDEARLVAVVVQKPRAENELETKWISYRSDDSRNRLDISYLIESEGNLAQIKLNDVFLVDGKRYLARGFYFRTYKASDGADESVKRLIRANQLNGPFPVIEENHN